ncbi:ABC transporter substrate-binding protein [Paenibacillus sp. NPDC058174]|uniref:ABC transporter substrate-binding protein n=1 Tax=Paenibacillus sp. NPDC058174 TaxID=3346366 RepID=UPI0036DAF18A
MTKMKTLSILSLVIVLLFVLSACSGGNTPPPAKPSDSTNQEAEGNKNQEEEKEPVVEEEKYDLGGREIRFSAWWDGTPNADTPEGEKALALQAEVEKKYNVKIKYVAQDMWETAEKFSSTVMAGEPFADVVLVPHVFVLSLLKGGYYTALDDFMNVKEESKLSDLIIKSGSYGTGKTYGFLNSVAMYDNTGLFYNKRIFQDAGLSTPTELQEQGKWDWDTFVDVAKKLTISKSGNGKIDQWGLTGSQMTLGSYLIYSNGGVIYDEDTEKIALDSPNAMEGLEMMNKLYNEYKIVKRDEGNSWEDPVRYFREGKVAMYPAGLWEVGRFQKEMVDEYAFVPFPKGPKADGFIMGQPQMHINVIPRGVKDPKVVYKIWEDLQDFEHIDENNRTTAESWFTDEASVENALNTFNIIKFARYGGLNIDDAMWDLVRDISDSKLTPASGVAKLMPVMQASVDKVLKGTE